MKETMGLLRPVLLAAALVCLIFATLVGWQIIDVPRGQAVLVTCAWGFWGVACYVGSKIAGELAA